MNVPPHYRKILNRCLIGCGSRQCRFPPFEADLGGNLELEAIVVYLFITDSVFLPSILVDEEWDCFFFMCVWLRRGGVGCSCTFFAVGGAVNE